MRMNLTLVNLSDEQMRTLLTSTGTLNRARQIFSQWREHINVKRPKPVAMRKMEYQAVLDIAKLLGVELTIVEGE